MLAIAVSQFFLAAANADSIELVSQAQKAPLPSEHGDAGSRLHTISADGRYVLFSSLATNMQLGQTQASFGIYRHDRIQDQFELHLGHANAAFSDVQLLADETGLLFRSRASNLLDSSSTALPFESGGIYLYNFDTGRVINFDPTGLLADKNAVLAGDGKLAAYPAVDANGAHELVLFDRTTGNLRRAALGSDEPLQPGSFSDDGRFLVVTTNATNPARQGASGAINRPRRRQR